MGFYIDNDSVTAVGYPNGDTTTLYRDGGWVRDEYKAWSFMPGIVSSLFNSWFNSNLDNISFTIRNHMENIITYSATSGMTWAQWVSSKYNTAGFYVESGSNLVRDSEGRVVRADNNSASVFGNTVIPSDGAFKVN
jgi:hypothetical protein